MLFFLTANFISALDFRSGISVIPYTHWGDNLLPMLFSGDNHLDYNIEPSVTTTLELSLKHKEWFQLGFAVDYRYNDNYVGQIIDSKLFTRISGLLGINNFAIRGTWSQIEGEAIWHGAQIPGQPERTTIDTKYTEILLLYYFGPRSLGRFMSAGLLYQNLQMPTTLGEGAGYCYDNITSDYYGAYFGMSTFIGFMDGMKNSDSNSVKDKNFIKPWLDSNFSLGYVHQPMTEEGKRRYREGEVLAGDYPLAEEYGMYSHWEDVFGFNWQITAGICGGFNINSKLYLGFGAGYDVVLSVNGMPSRHGAIAKMMISF